VATLTPVTSNVVGAPDPLFRVADAVVGAVTRYAAFGVPLTVYIPGLQNDELFSLL
jgi:hypothetical protein